MPLFHSNAVVAGWAVAALAAARRSCRPRFSASRFLDDVRHYGATYMNYVGKPLAYVLATPEQPDDADNPLRRGVRQRGERPGHRGVRAPLRLPGGGRLRLHRVRGDRDRGCRARRAGSIGQGYEGVAIYDPETVTECPVAEFDDERRAAQRRRGRSASWSTPRAPAFFQGYYNDPAANDERMRHGMYWSGDLAYKDADGFIYLAGRTADWMRVDGENLAAAPIERILLRLPAVNRVAVYAVPDPQRRRPGDGRARAPGRRHPDARRARGVPRRAGRPVLEGLAALRPDRRRPARRPPPTRCSSGS